MRDTGGAEEFCADGISQRFLYEVHGILRLLQADVYQIVDDIAGWGAPFFSPDQTIRYSCVRPAEVQLL